MLIDLVYPIFPNILKIISALLGHHLFLVELFHYLVPIITLNLTKRAQTKNIPDYNRFPWP